MFDPENAVYFGREHYDELLRQANVQRRLKLRRLPGVPWHLLPVPVKGWLTRLAIGST